MKDQKKLDGFLDTALLVLGAGLVWSIVYFGISIVGNTLMFAFPVLLVTVILASILFVTSFFLMRGFPLSDVSADARLSDRWSDEKKRAFKDGFQKRKKLCRRMSLISFGMLIPVIADLIILYLI